MEIREETAADQAAVRRVHESAFGAEGEKVAGLDDALREADGGTWGLSLVAEVEGAVAGHVRFGTALLDAPKRLVEVALLSPLGVLPELQGRGIATALVERGLAVLEARGAPLVFLEGDPGYYARLGFEAGGDFGFRKPSLRIPDAAFQVYPLAGYEPWMTGTLVYPHLFWDRDSVGLRDPSV
ncbi:N-acetyltransferase [Glycomyces sp. NPDC046736]|uniref:GNAT family N-acetyltransferase n=1 Tax=Glycomyces sp. NPDC046736 TaxID=3155615 RepID=UPI0033D31983